MSVKMYIFEHPSKHLNSPESSKMTARLPRKGPRRAAGGSEFRMGDDSVGGGEVKVVQRVEFNQFKIMYEIVDETISRNVVRGKIDSQLFSRGV